MKKRYGKVGRFRVVVEPWPYSTDCDVEVREYYGKVAGWVTMLDLELRGDALANMYGAGPIPLKDAEDFFEAVKLGYRLAVAEKQGDSVR